MIIKTKRALKLIESLALDSLKLENQLNPKVIFINNSLAQLLGPDEARLKLIYPSI